MLGHIYPLPLLVKVGRQVPVEGPPTQFAKRHTRATSLFSSL